MKKKLEKHLTKLSQSGKLSKTAVTVIDIDPAPGRTAIVQKMLKSTKPTPKAEQLQIPATLTYTELERTEDEDGFPVIRLLRSDGKKVRVDVRRFNELRKGQLVTPAPKPEPTLAKPLPSPEPVQLAAKHREAVSPAGFFGIHTASGSRIQIIDALDREWRDLLCYSYEMSRVVHIKVQDLFPTERVSETVKFLQHLR